MISPSIPTVGDPNSTEDVDVRNALITIRDVINGNIDSANAPSLVAGLLNHSVRVTRTTNANIPNAGSGQVLGYDSERHDTSSMHSTSSNPSRLTAPATGVYFIKSTVAFSQAGTSAGQISLQLRLNGTTTIDISGAGAFATFPTPGVWLNVSTQYKLSAGDYVETLCYQDSGTIREAMVIANSSPEFAMTYLCAG